MKNILSILFVLAMSISVNAQVLFLDAGHGGEDPGAISPTGVTEATINAEFVKEIKSLAEAKGFKVYLTHDLGKHGNIKDIVNKVNLYKATIGEKVQFVSIHANFSKDPLQSGCEVFVMPKEERSEGTTEFAQKMAGTLDATVLTKKLSILRDLNIPAVLIEVGYISNETDFSNMTTPDMRTLMVRKIVSAL